MSLQFRKLFLSRTNSTVSSQARFAIKEGFHIGDTVTVGDFPQASRKMLLLYGIGESSALLFSFSLFAHKKGSLCRLSSFCLKMIAKLAFRRSKPARKMQRAVFLLLACPSQNYTTIFVIF